MTSVLNVDTIADKAGTGPVALTKQIATKVYHSANSAGTILYESINVSSLGDYSTGRQQVNFANSMSSDSYHVDQMIYNNIDEPFISGRGTSSYLSNAYHSGAYTDQVQSTSATGSLA